MGSTSPNNPQVARSSLKLRAHTLKACNPPQLVRMEEASWMRGETETHQVTYNT